MLIVIVIVILFLFLLTTQSFNKEEFRPFIKSSWILYDNQRFYPEGEPIYRKTNIGCRTACRLDNRCIAYTFDGGNRLCYHYYAPPPELYSKTGWFSGTKR